MLFVYWKSSINLVISYLAPKLNLILYNYSQEITNCLHIWLRDFGKVGTGNGDNGCKFNKFKAKNKYWNDDIS